MQLHQWVEDRKYQKEERERARQTWELDMQDRKRKAIMDDFNLAQSLQGMGAVPEPRKGMAGELESELGGRTVRQTPIGQYAVPTRPTQIRLEGEAATRKASEAATQAGQVEEAKKRADLKVDPLQEMNVEGFGKVKVPESKQYQIIDAQLRRRYSSQNVKHDRFTNRETGDVTLTGTDPTGKEVYNRVLKGVAKPAAKTQKPKGISAGALRAMTNAQKLIDKANEPIISTPSKGYNDEEKQDISIKRWRAARAAVQQAMGAYPQELTGGPGEDVKDQAGKSLGYGFAHIEPVKAPPGDASTAPDTPDDVQPDDSETDDSGGGEQASAQTPKGKAIRRADLEQIAQIKDMHPMEFERQWQAAGGQIV
jgi:hypothetical protein